MIGHRHELARFQSDFYRNNYRKVLVALILSILVMIGLIAVIIYLILNQKNPDFYASTTNGQIIAMAPHTQ